MFWHFSPAITYSIQEIVCQSKLIMLEFSFSIFQLETWVLANKKLAFRSLLESTHIFGDQTSNFQCFS